MPTKYDELINDINLDNGVLDIQDKSYIKYEEIIEESQNNYILLVPNQDKEIEKKYYVNQIYPLVDAPPHLSTMS